MLEFVIAGLSGSQWVTLSVILLVLGVLTFTQIAADVILVGAVTILMFTGVIDTKQAFGGMANEGMLTVAVLYVVVAGLESTGATGVIVRRFLGRPRSVIGAMLRLMLPVTSVSAFLNNTPVVAMFMPAVSDWAKQNRISVSKLMMPLSYAAVLGGMCTLIGTSTNLIVHGLLISAGKPGMGFFDVTWIGIPCALAGVAMVMIAHPYLLPDRKPVIGEAVDPREYTVEMLVDPGSPLDGQTIEAAGLRHLPQLYLVEIERDGKLMPAVSSLEKLKGNDRLVFVGVVDSVIDLQRIRGLKPATNQVFKLDSPRSARVLIEAVVSHFCPLIGQTIRDGRFRSNYNAAVLAVARAGERINRKVGDIVLQAGDTLLLEAHPTFVEQQRNSRHFYLVSRVANSSPPRHERAWIALLILAGMVLAASLEWTSMLQAGLLAAGLMILTRCCTASAARRSVDWQTLIAIAASFALGKALESSGLAQLFAERLIGMACASPWLSLVVVYGVTILLTEMITNNAAAVLAFPIAMRTAETLGVDYMPFVVVVAAAASLGFATPFGYQTHLMIYGPGGYRFTDFLRLGVPLDLLCWAITVLVVPLVFPLKAV